MDDLNPQDNANASAMMHKLALQIVIGVLKETDPVAGRSITKLIEHYAKDIEASGSHKLAEYLREFSVASPPPPLLTLIPGGKP